MWGADFNLAGRQAIEHGISMGRVSDARQPDAAGTAAGGVGGTVGERFFNGKLNRPSGVPRPLASFQCGLECRVALAKTLGTVQFKGIGTEKGDCR